MENSGCWRKLVTRRGRGRGRKPEDKGKGIEGKWFI